MELNQLYIKAEGLAGRPVEVEQLQDGRFIVMWMRFDVPPPEPGSTEVEALERFIDKMLQLPKEPDSIEA